MVHTEQFLEILEGIIGRFFIRHVPSPWSPFVLGTGAGDEERVIDVKLAEIEKSFSVGPQIHMKFSSYCIGSRDVQVCFAEMLGRESLLRSLGATEPGSIARGGKPPGNPSAYKLICLIDRTGKVLEKIILNRMLRHT